MNHDPSTLLARATRIGLITAVVGGVIAIAGWIATPASFYYGYLAAYLFWLGPMLGAVLILTTHHLSTGRWSLTLRPALEAAAMTVPLTALLFIPIIPAVWRVYPWANEAMVRSDHILEHQSAYLNPPLFFLRSAVYLVVWIAFAWAVATHSRAQPSRQLHTPWGLTAICGLGLVAYAFTIGFASIDWFASLQARWYSSIFGIYLLVIHALTAFTLLIIIAIWLADRTAPAATPPTPPPPPYPLYPSAAPPPIEPATFLLPPKILQDWGSLLLALVIFHTYIAFSQFFIIWNGNLPSEAAWYFPRTEGTWGRVAILLALIHFALPFAALLARVNKRSPRQLVAVAGLILAARVIEAMWMVLPSARPATEAIAGEGVRPDPIAILMSLASMAAIGGVWLAAFAWLWRRSPDLIVPPQVVVLPRETGEVPHTPRFGSAAP